THNYTYNICFKRKHDCHLRLLRLSTMYLRLSLVFRFILSAKVFLFSIFSCFFFWRSALFLERSVCKSPPCSPNVFVVFLVSGFATSPLRCLSICLSDSQFVTRFGGVCSPEVCGLVDCGVLFWRL